MKDMKKAVKRIEESGSWDAKTVVDKDYAVGAAR